MLLTENELIGSPAGSDVQPIIQSLNHQEGKLKVRPLVKSGYYIVPNPSTTL